MPHALAGKGSRQRCAAHLQGLDAVLTDQVHHPAAEDLEPDKLWRLPELAQERIVHHLAAHGVVADVVSQRGRQVCIRQRARLFDGDHRRL